MLPSEIEGQMAFRTKLEAPTRRKKNTMTKQRRNCAGNIWQNTHFAHGTFRTCKYTVAICRYKNRTCTDNTK